jgi:hypothetical protein
VIAMIAGITSVLILCKVTIPAFDIFALFTGKIVAVEWVFGYFMPEWWPKISWPWFVFVGCLVTLAISVLFPTPKSQILAAEEHVRHVPEPARAES